MANHLAAETSPYLLQHAHNPVDWFPWGEAAFRKAAAEGKPIFLSIGYSTCHWCHVMEGDSFEKEDVAEILNKHFVAIKVDREERPDVDAYYMKAVQAMNQRGGWPLSAVLTDEGKPFWGGTFYPREQFKAILLRIREIWEANHLDVKDRAFELGEHLKIREADLFQPAAAIDHKAVEAFLRGKAESFDPRYGGFGAAPKFPPAMALLLLLREPRYKEIVRKTLGGMARGGMRDHVGGGFHRYSVDEKWMVPHFEKMLYDNALLTLAYTEAFALSGSPEDKRVVETTLDYILRDMTGPEGGFYSAEDADSEKTEGKFYVWGTDDLEPALLAEVQKYFEFRPEGNFEISRQVEEMEAAAGLKAVRNANILHHIGKDVLPEGEAYESLLAELLARRSKRVRPGLDDKIIAGWNGLMIAALARAGRVLQDPRYTEAARRSWSFLSEKMVQDETLLRSYRAGKAKQPAFLEDYAALIWGLIELYQTTLEPAWLEAAVAWQARQDQLFWDHETGGYFDDQGADHHLPHRGKDYMDAATPSGNGLSAYNLARLFKLTGDTKLLEASRTLLKQAGELMGRFPGNFPMLHLALSELHTPSLVIAGPLEPAVLKAVPSSFAWVQYASELEKLCPVLKGKAPAAGAKTLFYRCEGETCQRPLTELSAVLSGQASLS